MDRNHVALDVGLMHNLEADGAETAALVGLRPEVFGVPSPDVPRPVVRQ